MNALTQKLGPLPRWVYLVLVGGAILYWHYRHATGSSLSTPVMVTPSAAPSGTSDLSSLGAPPSAGTTDSGGVNSAANDLLSTLGAQQGDLLNAVLAGEQNVTQLAATQQANLVGAFSGTAQNPVATSTTPVTAPQPGTGNAPTVTHQPAPFGGVVSTKKLKTGAIVTTYGSGRQTEQLPGRSAYVVHK